MPLPPAPAGRLASPSSRLQLVPAIVLLLLVALSGCGSESSPDSTGDRPSEDAVACRAQWRTIEREVDDRDSASNPSALRQRWNSIVATSRHYVTAGKASDCGSTLAAEKEAIAALTAFSAKLAAYDMELRRDRVTAAAEQYAAAPRPPAPSPSPAKKGKKAKKVPRPPKPADVATALRTLVEQAPVATAQQAPAWRQARVTDPSDAAAVAKAVKDLAFLSSESSAYRACSAALALINEAVAPKTP